MALLWSKNNRVTKSWALLVTSPHHWSINTVTNASLAGMLQASSGFVMCHVFFRILPLQRFDSKEIWVQVYFYLSRRQNTLALRAIKKVFIFLCLRESFDTSDDYPQFASDAYPILFGSRLSRKSRVSVQQHGNVISLRFTSLKFLEMQHTDRWMVPGQPAAV